MQDNEWGLSERQFEIARLLPFHSDDDIAEQLGISPSTVKANVAIIRYKMHVKTRKEVNRLMYEAGYLD